MPPPSIETIPPELQELTMAFVRRPSDFKSLCLTSQQMRQLAIPRLYHQVALDLVRDDTMCGFFRVNHPGHKHIRSFIVICDVYGLRKITARVEEAIQLALQQLPRDKLEELVIPDYLTLTQRTLHLICARQRSLRSLNLPAIFDRLASPP